MDVQALGEAVFGDRPALRALQVVGVFAAAVVVNRILQRRFERPVLLARAPRRVVQQAAQLTRVVVFGVALVVAVSLTRLPVSRLVTSLGVLALVAAFVANQLLGNLIAGLVLLLDPHFGVGDRLEMHHLPVGARGPFTVVGVGLRTTRLRGPEGELVVIPNVWFLTNPYVNRTPSEGDVAAATSAAADHEEERAGRAAGRRTGG